ncbi:hydrogenase maturation protease [Halopolyspora algeriensis]|uniref:Hydrogenase maturation protease n=1 Tax=Halopolyspora algeriensis TaxID=1500506 RepID=A0A368VSG2_9ACTN|nr:hydrogenase maturation protease [Halopolyspora algeriensis]RCW44639.1 hydrogenase maturation protease [Halopolyspora algeriensis]TQM56000.1 hydrogenase maturation protease [Halopolyspora algeriensis]
MSARVLAAGVGNVFLGDDGFGVDVVGRLAAEQVPEGVHVADFGIRGVHLAYELLDGYDAVLLIDALPRGDEPGTLYVLEPDLDTLEPLTPGTGGVTMDAHGMNPEAVLSLCKTLGGLPGRALVLGCEPADCSERMGLSEPVAAAVDPAVEKVRELLAEMVETTRTATSPTAGIES